jgi:DNA processing protein
MDRLTAVALSTLSGLTRTRAFAVFKELRNDGESPEIEEVIAFASPGANADRLAAEARERAAALLADAVRQCIGIVQWDDNLYPALLGAIADPPPVLWVRGNADALSQPAVAIVGSRAASAYALEVAARLGGELAARGVVVVSGLARGADGAAHRGCLDAGGTTVAVLGSGVDRIYPPEHDALAATICKDGALVSEFGPGTPPLPDHFPLRNRLISGVSLGVVVVEANEKSGSLITARYALEQGRDVMAVPGSVLGGRNRGSHALLKDGAKVVETADDILEELGWSARPATRSPGSLEQDELLQKLIPGQAYDLDELSATVEKPGSDLLSRLTEWEMRGLLKKVPGGRYVLVGRAR